MKNLSRLVAILFAAILIIALWTLVGCERPQVGQPDYNDPIADQSPYEPAEEFKYLVDFDNAMLNAESTVEELKAEGELPEEMSDVNFEEIATELGLDELQQEEITSEANDKMVHAHGRYKILGDEIGFWQGLAEVGTSEVKLPGHFPSDRWMGHLFIANPGAIVDMGMRGYEEMMEEMGEEDMNMMMPGMGEDAEMMYGWIGDEFLIFNLLNPDYDENAEATAENMPVYSLMGASTVEADFSGIDIMEMMLGNPIMMMLFGIMPERTEIEGYDAFLIPIPTFEGEMYDEMVTDEVREQLAMIPPMMAVQLPGYLLFGDQVSVEEAVGLFDESGTGTGRLATVEMESNLDISVQSFAPTNPGLWLKLLESPELQQLFIRFQTETAGLSELGTSRAAVIAQDGENLELDILTSRESIRLFEIVQEIIEDTPPETWEEMGQIFGEYLSEQGSFTPQMPPMEGETDDLTGADEQGDEKPGKDQEDEAPF